jgi:hypothetical protein
MGGNLHQVFTGLNFAANRPPFTLSHKLIPVIPTGGRNLREMAAPDSVILKPNEVNHEVEEFH